MLDKFRSNLVAGANSSSGFSPASQDNDIESSPMHKKTDGDKVNSTTTINNSSGNQLDPNIPTTAASDSEKSAVGDVSFVTGKKTPDLPRLRI